MPTNYSRRVVCRAGRVLLALVRAVENADAAQAWGEACFTNHEPCTCRDSLGHSKSVNGSNIRLVGDVYRKVEPTSRSLKSCVLCSYLPRTHSLINDRRLHLHSDSLAQAGCIRSSTVFRQCLSCDWFCVTQQPQVGTKTAYLPRGSKPIPTTKDIQEGLLWPRFGLTRQSCGPV
jgi:hypothetical protein